MSNPLIVVEGGDGAGKATQVRRLNARLAELGLAVSVFSFPRHGKPYDLLIKRGLKGEFGDFLSLNPYVASALWAADRAGARDELLDALKRSVVILDRYVRSNLAYQGAKLSGDARMEFIRFTEEAEYEYLGLPKPDLVIYLSVPTDVSGKLSASRGEQDQHEASTDYQEDVAVLYHELARSRPNWKIIECMREGKLRDPDDIHHEVAKLSLALLSKNRTALS